jgi:hypothetical protein
MSEAASSSLLTFHGTFLSYDPARHALCHRPPDQGAGRVEIPALAPSALLGAAVAPANQDWPPPLRDLRFAPGLHDGTVALRRGGHYATAERGGDVAIFVAQCIGWESFLPVTSTDFAVLAQMLAGEWTLQDTGETEAATLGANFSLRFGAFEIDLVKSLPFGDAAGGRLTLAARDPARGTVTVLRAGTKAARTTKIWINTLGNTGNRALQYLAAEGIRRLVPGAVIENLDLHEWGITAPAPPPAQRSSGRTGDLRLSIDVPGLADCLRRGVVETIVLESYTFHIDHYPARAECRRLLGPTIAAGASGYGPDTLVCSIRGREILHAQHPDYLPLPAAYYRMLVDRSGLTPVFLGQIDDNAYTASLRREFPDAQFVGTINPAHDFEVLRRSVNLALSISSFAWTAAWLGEPKRVYLPVGGMFSPIQHPDSLFLPLDEPEYEFLLLPFARAVSLFEQPEDFWRQQALLAAHARPTDVTELRMIRARAAPRGKGRTLAAGFDPDFYLRTYPDVAPSVDVGEQSALTHWLHSGGREGRQPLAFDPKFYVKTYPEAAMALAEGRVPDALAHYQTEGIYLGYEPLP